MKLTKCFVLTASVFLLLTPVFAQTDLTGLPPSPDVNPFLDPAVQDFVEMTYGYRNPKNTPGSVNDFRDALISLPITSLMSAKLPAAKNPSQAPAVKAAVQAAAKPMPGQYYKVTFANESGPISAYVNTLDPNALSGFGAGDYVFITVLPRTEDHPALIRSLSGTGFKFVGEKTYFTGAAKKTFLLGWAPYSNLEGIYKNPKVKRVAIEKKASGVPFKTRIRFTLKAPGGELSSAFVSDFIRQLGSAAGFSPEKVFRLPRNSAGAKFTVFEVTGNLPVDMVGAVSRSPFVAAVECKDQSL